MSQRVTARPVLIASCACGAVTVEAAGRPITSAVCYCDDCQAGARQVEAMPGAPRVQDGDGGTSYVFYRKDRVRTASGAELLHALKLKPNSATNRVMATCCNSAMFLNFDDAKHWVNVYRSRLRGDPPPLEMRFGTRFRPSGVELPNDVPSYPGYPFRLIAKLILARLAMLIST